MAPRPLLFPQHPQPYGEGPRLAKVEPWSAPDQLDQELSAVGFYLSGHPLEDMIDLLRRKRTTLYTDAVVLAEGGAEAFRMPQQTQPYVAGPEGLRVGLCRSPVWSAIEPSGAEALETAAKRLQDAGAIVEELILPEPFNSLHEAHGDIVQTEGGFSFLPEYLAAYDILAPDLRGKVENVRGVTPEKLLASYTLADSCRPAFDGLFGRGLEFRKCSR